MTKYRIKEYQGKFTVEEREVEETRLGPFKKWVAWRTLLNDVVKYDTLKEAKEHIDHAIIMNQEPKYHYYPEETK